MWTSGAALSCGTLSRQPPLVRGDSPVSSFPGSGLEHSATVLILSGIDDLLAVSARLIQFPEWAFFCPGDRVDGRSEYEIGTKPADQNPQLDVAGVNFWIALGQQIYAFALGILYAYWREKSGSLLAPIIGHNVSDGVSTCSCF